METIITNQWTDARRKKPFKNRKVLARFSNGHEAVVKWNGMYWVGQYDMRLTLTAEITHW